MVSSVFIKKLRSRESVLFLLWPVLFYFALSCYSKVQIGHRHLLPIYPFLTVWISGLYPLITKRVVKIAGVLLLIWYASCAVRIHPWHLSYFNEVVGSPDNGYNYLTDSNLDWGQGMKSLGKYLKEEKVSGIYLCYFGVSDPHYYGIKYVPIGFIDSIGNSASRPLAKDMRAGDEVDFAEQPKILFAISATNLQMTYYASKEVFSWLKDIKPEKIVAHSIFVYNLSEHPKHLEKLREMIKH